MDVPFYAHEADMTRLERANRRWFIICVILILSLILSNAAWIWYESQFSTEQTTTEIQQEAENEAGDILLNGTGEVFINGESKTDN